MFQIQSPSIRTVTTAHLAQTMTLLNQTVGELYQQIQQELTNPALELVEERRCPNCHRSLTGHGECPVCSRPNSMAAEEPVVFVSPREEFYSSGSGSAELIPDEPVSPIVEELPVFVLRQIAVELEGEDRKIAAFMLTHLDEDGFLTISPVEVARYFHVPISRVERIKQMIQRAEPVGVGSSGPQEALLIQLELLSDSHSIPPLAREIIAQAMDLLSRRQYAEIARKFSVSVSRVQDMVKFIGENLNPFPARAHWGDVRQPSPKTGEVYYHPDILISYLNNSAQNPLMVEIVLPIRGYLRINPLFRQAARLAAEDTRIGMKSDLERAALFVKCLQQRNHTMQRLMQRVVSIKRDFIL
ncbi:MAG: hypothetical protein AB1453_12775, partial [Chloroflexota bacterium]